MVRFMMALAALSMVSSTPARAYKADTLAAFVLSALVTNYVSSKRTVADVRAKAQKMIEDYEENHVLFKFDDINWAYGVMRATDQELENRLWWNNIIRSSIFGALSSLAYHSFRYPNPATITIHNHYPDNRCGQQESACAAPFFQK
ncbi:hypothetical protein JST99_01910 [Candidatus Dependentiae bacterium]|nr:hypothetical protein [Candidatus Dependentiae bacterium]MCC7414739.1 hypothetical protein [Campylobacterota bacterium]